MTDKQELIERPLQAVRALIKPDSIIAASDIHLDDFDRKSIFNALTYLVRTGELAHIGYGRYQSPPTDAPHEGAPTTDKQKLRIALADVLKQRTEAAVDTGRDSFVIGLFFARDLEENLRTPDPELAKVTAERDEALQYAANIRAQYENLEASEVVNGYKNRTWHAESLLASRTTAIEAAIEAMEPFDMDVWGFNTDLMWDDFRRATTVLAQLRSLIAGKETDIG